MPAYDPAMPPGQKAAAVGNMKERTLHSSKMSDKNISKHSVKEREVEEEAKNVDLQRFTYFYKPLSLSHCDQLQWLGSPYRPLGHCASIIVAFFRFTQRVLLTQHPPGSTLDSEWATFSAVRTTTNISRPWSYCYA